MIGRAVSPRPKSCNEAITAVRPSARREAARCAPVTRPGYNLTRPEVVQRNESVTIVYEVPGIPLTVRGKALEAGAVGDLVSVLNIQSNRTVQTKVTGPGRVIISSAGPLIAPVRAQHKITDDPSPRTQ